MSVFDTDSNAWTQRAWRDEVALAFGLSKPLLHNQYGELDMFAVALTVLISNYIKIDMKRSAALVREHWRGWLDGLARAERARGRTVYSEGICFVIATNPDKTLIKAAVGPCEDVINEMGGGEMVPFPFPLDLVERQLRAAARKAGVSLPKSLTPGPPDTEAYRKWITDIETYRQIAATRRTGRKTKERA
ncbi:hypothetical protein ACVI1L_000709 [Bradyrhizobium sp. USDA 4516]